MKGISVGSFALIIVFIGCEVDRTENITTEEIPRFEVDADWPQKLPNKWILGQVSGLFVDSRNHVWIAQRPGSLTPHEAAAAQDPPIARCCVPAPAVIEFAPDGSVIQAWGGPGEGYEWTDSPHGIYVDHQDHVWIAGGIYEHHLLKFTREGEFILQIGEKERTGGSNDKELLGGPADMVVDPEFNEIYIADGYVNRRVIVLDAETGEYRRHWGAYGEKPHDKPLGTDNLGSAKIDSSRQFRGPVHGITIADDELVYVTDRENNRIQVFQKDGTYIEEVLVRPETRSTGSTWDISPSDDRYKPALKELIPGSTWDVALSKGSKQKWLYVADGTNNVVWILERSSLKVIGHFGHGGKNAGYFGWLHNISTDSHGNIFTSEVDEDKRVQKFNRVK